MQEITEQSVGFVIRAGKLTLRLIARAAAAYLRHRARKKHEKKIEKMNKQPEIAKKMKVKELVQSGQGVSTIELRDEGIRKFERLCKKNGVSYAIQADKSTTPPTYTVFFKAKNVDVIDSMLKQFTKKQLEKGEKKKREPVIKPKLEKYKAKVKAAGAKKSKTKTKQKVR